MAASDSVESPARRGYVFPAEWERHEVTWLSWPNSRGATFPGEMLGEVFPSFTRLVEALVEAGETVAINVSDEFEQSAIESALGDSASGSVRFEMIPTNEPWVRDHGPTVLRHPGTGDRLAVCWNYNAWGGKYPPWDLDAAAAPRMAEAYGLDTFPRRDLTIEGGSLESDGEGCLMVSRSSVVSPSRNPGWSGAALERELMETTGAREILWVDGEVPGDDTDGHVDCFARFAPGRVLLALEPDTTRAGDHPSLADNARRLKAWARDRGREFAGLPIPDPIVVDGMELPVTYANFYVANTAVVFPVFEDTRDRVAEDIIGHAFPGRKVIPFPARELIMGQGGIHCLTQQLPAGLV